MKPMRTAPLLRSSLAGIARRGSCWLLLAGGLVFPWLAPLVTPWNEQPVILQPARAQAAWVYAWLALFSWIPFQAAVLGKRLRADGQLEFFQSLGTRAVALWWQAGAAVAVWAVLLALVAALVCVGPCLPRAAADVWPWIALVLQYVTLFAAAAIPLVMLTLAAGTRFGEVAGFTGAAGWLFLGLIAAPLSEPVFAGSDSPWMRGVWLAYPHTHLADLTPRLVFKMGPLAPASFGGSLLVLLLQGSAMLLLGKCLFRTRL